MKESEEQESQRLSLKELRAIETHLNVFLNKPVNPDRNPNQQFGVYDGHTEEHVGDIVADDLYFEGNELRGKIGHLYYPIQESASPPQEPKTG